MALDPARAVGMLVLAEILRTLSKEVPALSAAITALVFLTACGEQVRSPAGDCQATYLEIKNGRSLLFLVGCKGELETVSPQTVKGLQDLLVNQKTRPLKASLEEFRKQTGRDRLTACLKISDNLEVLDEDSSWSCILSKSSKASSILFGPKAPMLDLDRAELARVADETDRLIATKDFELLGETGHASFRSGAAEKLNTALGRRAVDDIYLYSYNISEQLP